MTNQLEELQKPASPSLPPAAPKEPSAVPSMACGDRPIRRAKVTATAAWELGGSALGAAAFVLLVFSIAGLSIMGWTPLFGLLASWFLVFLTVYGVVCWQRHGILRMKEKLASVVLWAGFLVAFIPLVFILFYVAFKGMPVVLARFPHFFYGNMVAAGGESPVTAVGDGPAIVGTLEQVGLGVLFTVPLGILSATYLIDARGFFGRLVSTVVDAMTGAPAIIAGVFIYILWVAPRHTNGKSGFAASLALSVMMLPIVTRAAQEVVTVVPGSLREASLALGAPRWRTIVRVVLPTARAGLMTAVILAVARVAGETAPILFDAGGSPRYNWNPFSGFQDDLPLRIYELIFQPGINIIRDAWGTSFVLVLLVLGLFILARIAGRSGPGRRISPLARIRRSAGLQL
jgi:phosphate transport system permease protein